MQSGVDGFDVYLKRIRGNQVETEVYLDRYMPCKVLNILYDVFGAGDVFTASAPEGSRHYVHQQNLRKSFLSSIKQLLTQVDEKIRGEEYQDKLSSTIQNPLKKLNNF